MEDLQSYEFLTSVDMLMSPNGLAELDEFLQLIKASIFDNSTESSPASPLAIKDSKMEDIPSALMDYSDGFVEFDEILKIVEAPIFFDFTTDDRSQPYIPSQPFERIDYNRHRKNVDPEDLDRSFKNRVTPTLKHGKAQRPDVGRLIPKYAHSVPVKPAVTEKHQSVASKPQKTSTTTAPVSQICSQKLLDLKKVDCPMLNPNQEGKFDTRLKIEGKLSSSSISTVILDQLPSGSGAKNLKDSIVCVIPNSINSIYFIPETNAKVCLVHASSQGTQSEIVASSARFDANKENISNTRSSEQITKKGNLLQKACKDPSKSFDINHLHQGDKSKRVTKHNPFELLTNARVTQRKGNMEAQREAASTLSGRDRMRINQLGRSVQKSQHLRNRELPSSETNSKLSVVHASRKGTRADFVESSIEFVANKENISNTTCFKENFKKPNLLQKTTNDKSKNFLGNDISQQKRSNRTTKPKPFKLLTNERGIQREANSERKMNLDAWRKDIRNKQNGRTVQKAQSSEAKQTHGKMVRLALNKLMTNNSQHQKSESNKEKLGEKSHKEFVKVATSSLNAHSSSLHGNKVITANACSQVKRSTTAPISTETTIGSTNVNNKISGTVKKSHPNGARIGCSKMTRLAGNKLITRIRRSNKPEMEKFGEKPHK